MTCALAGPKIRGGCALSAAAGLLWRIHFAWLFSSRGVAAQSGCVRPLCDGDREVTEVVDTSAFGAALRGRCAQRGRGGGAAAERFALCAVAVACCGLMRWVGG